MCNVHVIFQLKMASGNGPVRKAKRSRGRRRGRYAQVAAPDPVQPAHHPLFSCPPHDLIINDQEEIDHGAYGSVFPGEFAGSPVAVKRIHPLLLQAELDQGRIVRQDFKAECQRLKDIGDHPNVVGFLGAYQDGKGPFLVMEKMTQNLQKFLENNRGSLRLQQQMQLCLDIATGLEFLHLQNPPVVHRDLSAKNVLLDEAGRAKIGDLGQSKLKKDSHFETRQPGAIPYMPPEALRAQPLYNEKVDIFSFGVLMLEIATQSAPSSSLEGINVIPEEDRRRSDLALLPEDHPLKPLIRKCLKDDPAGRPDAVTLFKNLQEMLQRLQHQQLLPSASVVFTKAKECFIRAIEPLEKSHCEVMKLTRKTRSPGLQDLSDLRTDRVGEILRLLKRSEMKVVFFGRTSNGKSTVINALLKSMVLPFGAGSTTTAICYIRGQNTTSKGSYVKCDDDSSEVPVKSADELAPLMEDKQVVQINWSTAQCSMLKGDIVLVDCPGMNAESEMDAKVIECCSDADVFVYVASGFTTFETAERDLLAKVKEKISSPSNTFILFNHWDRVLEDGEKKASKVKQQQLSKVNKIMVEELGIFTEQMVEERTFFVSAKQAVNAAVGCAANAQQTGGPLVQEFSRFEETLQECLIEAAIKTKFGRHYNECQPIVASVSKALASMKHRWQEESDASTAEEQKRESLIAKIDERLQCFHMKRLQTLEEIDLMCEDFHTYIKARLLEEIENHQGGFSLVCEGLTRRLRNLIKEYESQRLTKQWIAKATDVVLSLSDPLEHAERRIIRLKAERASSRLGSQDVESTQLPVIRVGLSDSAKSALLGVGAGLLAGAVAGLLAGSGAARLTAATVAASVGGWSYAKVDPNEMTEEERAKMEIRNQVLEYLNQYKDERMITYRARLQEHVQSSTDATCRRIEEQKRRHEEAVTKLTDRLRDLGPWLTEASCLEDTVNQMGSEFDQFQGTYLHTSLD